VYSTNQLDRLTAWWQLHREKLTDALLLGIALNVPSVFLGPSRPPLLAQTVIFVALALFSAAKINPIESPWKRYLTLLPGYIGTVAVSLGAFIFWLGLPKAQWTLAPLWLVLTAIARVPVRSIADRIIDPLNRLRADVLVGDLAIVLFATGATGRWTMNQPIPWLLTLILGAGWIAANFLLRWQSLSEPRNGRWLGIWLLAAAWASVGPTPTTTGSWIFALWLGATLTLFRMAVQRFANSPSEGPWEVWRWLGLVAIVTLFFHPFLRPGVHGGGDARYYATFLADALAQFRAGVFPVFVGQSEYQFNGSVLPIRIAPGFQYLGGLVDLLTARSLGPLAIQNSLIVATAFLGTFITYGALRNMGTPAACAWMLTLLYLGCPGTMGLAFNTDLYMSWLAFPLVPLVLLLSQRTFAITGPRHYAGLGFVVGLSWWMHSPIALWLTLVAAVIQLGRMLSQRRSVSIVASECLAGALSFLLVAAYPLVSAGLYPADPDLGAGGVMVVLAQHVVQQLRETFPDAWLPLSVHGRQLGDFQLGYGILIVGTMVVYGAWQSRKVENRVLIGLSAAILLLLIPVPLLNQALWTAIPNPVRVVTNVWVMQRLYLLVGGLVIFIAALQWSQHSPGRNARIGLLIASIWSFSESFKFLAGSWHEPPKLAVSDAALRPENITLTRYSYGLFNGRPASFSHGVTDPLLENRLLSKDLVTRVADNLASAAEQAAEQRTIARTLRKQEARLEADEPVRLTAGRKYLVRFIPPSGFTPTGTLVLEGSTLHRVYGLPEYGESRSFGFGGTRVPYFPLHTTSSSEDVQFTFVPPSQSDADALDGEISLQLSEYSPESLPVNVKGWIPFSATVHSPEAAWLETPRMHQQGYLASVNGAAADIRRTPDGLVGIAIPTGTSEIELRYVAPLGLRNAFWISLAAIGAGLCAACGLALNARRFDQHMRRRAAP